VRVGFKKIIRPAVNVSTIISKRKFLALAAAIIILPTTIFAETKIDPARVQEIAATLAPVPSSFGQPITNRAAWKKIAATPEAKNLIHAAEKLATRPDPQMTDELYLDFSKTGNRDRGQNVQFERTTRLATFALAECIENRGRFLKPLDKNIEAICAERAWTHPAHDANLDVFYGRAMNPDLRATSLAFDIATADFLLGDKLPAATRQLIRDNVRRRVLQPYRDMVEGRLREMFWLRATHNWNAVCLAGTTGAALALEDSPRDRAWFIASAENYIQYFLRSFTPDGYCSEGVGYWNYGFGHFIILSEAIRQATGGAEDLFKSKSVAQPALFGFRAEILNGIYPSIADCAPGTRPDAQILDYVSQRFDLGRRIDVPSQNVDTKSLAVAAMNLFREQPLPIAQRVDAKQDSLRTWFKDGGVLIARPTPGDPAQFAVALKGGNNAENHNHNDVGSFSVVSGNAMVICDPGGEVYTKRTFGPHRYDSKVINSFGHAVPIVAGKLQSTGAAAKAVVLRTNFTDDADTLALDIRSAYAVPELRKLDRTFIYRRGANASLTVTDEVGFDQPADFESALITWGKWKKISADEIEIADDTCVVLVKIDTGGVPFEIRSEEINEDVHTPKKPWHLGIGLKSPVTSARIVLIITPAKTAVHELFH
jgi:hypothetical protein